MSGKLIFVTGGVKSGKSAFAEKVTSKLGQRITYLATAEARDKEMRNRIVIHQERRPENWTTVEEPLKVTAVLKEYGSKSDVIMLDCLTMLLTNLMFKEAQIKDKEFQKESLNNVLEEIQALADAAKEAEAHVVIVSNEVGLSLVSENYLGRQYQELVGIANQMIAQQSDEAYLVVSGYPIDMKKGAGLYE
jgi:adenosylcobinamide kinase/adenosylcobinamide-phosphate guanylyltransferase